MSRESRHAILISLAVVLAFVVAVTVMACGSGTAEADQPKPAADQPKPPGWRLFTVPGDVYPVRVVTFCDGGNRLYLANSGVGVAAADPSCVGR